MDTSIVTIPQLRAAIAPQGYLGADDFAIALGREPGKKWQRRFKRVLERAGIEPVRMYIDGKQRRVYRASDFEADDAGAVVGTHEREARLKERATRNLRALTVRQVLTKLLATYRDLNRDNKLSPKQRFVAIGQSLEYWDSHYQPRDESY